MSDGIIWCTYCGEHVEAGDVVVTVGKDSDMDAVRFRMRSVVEVVENNRDSSHGRQVCIGCLLNLARKTPELSGKGDWYDAPRSKGAE